MKRNLLSAISLAIQASLSGAQTLASAKTRDVSFTYRMGAGFPGDVNRTHPVSILPAVNDTTNPVRLYGDPVIVNTSANTVRGLLVGDTGVTRIYGVVSRPYPIQQTSGGPNASFGVGVPPAGPSVIDIVEDGFVMVRCNNFAATQPTKDGAVYIWIAASSGAQVQGGFSSVASVGNTIAITNARFNGPADSNGYCELRVVAS